MKIIRIYDHDDDTFRITEVIQRCLENELEEEDNMFVRQTDNGLEVVLYDDNGNWGRRFEIQLAEIV